MQAAPQYERQQFHHPHTSLGAAGHWIKSARILAPLIIGEFVKDADKRWRYATLASVATALLSEGMWVHKIQKEREEWQEHLGMGGRQNDRPHVGIIECRPGTRPW
jgi:hypothetical protein